MWQALTHAGRQIARRRSQGITVIAIMALSIGSCVAIFSMVKAVLLADFGYADAERLAIIWHARPNVPGVIGVSPGDYASYRSTLRTVDGLAVVSTRGFNLGAGTTPARITCGSMTAEMFPLLGVAPSKGQWFTTADERAGSRVVILSHRLWMTHFGGAGDVIDREVVLDAVRYRIAGIMPDAFTFPPEGVQGLAPADCWVPASFTPVELAIPSFSHVIFARVRAGVSWEQVSIDAHAGAQRIWSTYPAAVQSQVQLTARVVPLAEQTLSRSRTPLYLFVGAVIGLLLIGCANVSNLLLTSFEARRGELAVRASLGATWRTLVLQLMAEAVLLAFGGGLGGVVLAHGLLSAMVSTNAAAFPRLAEAHVDRAALLFAVGCGLLAGAAAALAPAWRAGTRSAASDAHGFRTAARGFGGSNWRRSVIAFELALAVAVLVLAGVLLRSVAGLNRIDAGFAVNDLLTFSVALPEAKYQGSEQIAGVRESLSRELGSVRGVAAVAVSSALPIGEALPGVVFAGSTAVARPQYQPTLVHRVTPDFAEALRLTIREGRFIGATDVDRSGIAVLNESLARTLFPEGLALGRSLSQIGAATPLTVVGIVADVRQSGPLRPAAPALYLPFTPDAPPVRILHVVMRTSSTPGELTSQIRHGVAGIDPELPAFAIRSGRDLLNGTIAGHRFNMLVVGIFAAFSLALAISGLYSVLAHAVQQARRDFGIRQALGATSGVIVRSVLTRALVPALIGIGVGGLVASAASELIASLLFGVRPNDPLTLATVALSVATLCVLAVLVPALRAARADLVTLLRHE